MNKSYRTVWNASTGTWGAADELARGKTKGSSRVARNAFAVIALGGVMVGGASAADVLDGTDSVDETNGVSQTVGKKSSVSDNGKVGGLAANDLTNVGGGDSTPIDLSRVVNSPAGTNVGVVTESSATDGIQSSGIGIMGALDGATVVGTTNVAIGPGAAVRMTNTANPTNAIAIGNNALVGDGDVSNPSGTIAIGASSRAGGGGSIVIGESATNLGSGAIAIGSSAYSQRGVAVGTGARGVSNGSVALGTGATATPTNSVALGSGSIANRGNAVSVGSDTLQRQITNVATGTQATDAVNLAQMNAAIAAGGDPLSRVRGFGDTPPPATAATQNTVAIGGGAYANDMFMGGTIVNGGAVAIGEHASATAGAATAVGGYSRADVFGSAFGDMASASGQMSSAFGFNAKASGQGSIAVGANSVADRDNIVSVGSAAQQRQIVNVAAGTQQNDAVNVGQLAGVVGAMGGGAQVNPDGSIQAPTYNVDGTNVHNVGDAISNLDERTTDLADRFANSGLVDPVTGAPVAAVTYDDPTKASVTLGGADGTGPVTLKNVAAGEASTDAVNVGQMKDALAAKADDTLIKVRGNESDPASATAASERAIAIGGGAYADDRWAPGGGVTGGAVALGERATAAGSMATAVGGFAYAGREGSAFGDEATASGVLSSAFGVQAVASEEESTAVGSGATAAGAGATALGVAARAHGQDSVAIGAGARTQGVAAVALGADSVADRDNTVSVGSATQQRQIVNVAAGTQQNDAVNVGQLAGVVGALGGGAKVNPDGTIGAPTYTVGGTDVRTVGDALSNLDGRTTELTDRFANSGLIDPVTGAPLAAVTYDDPTKASVTLGGSTASRPVTLKNVAQGVDGTDAVNVDQLTGATQSIRDDLAAGTLDMRYIKVNATGVQANAAGANAVAIGSGANANGVGALALGTGSRAQGVNSVALGFNSVATQANTVSVGRAGAERKVVNVANGDVNADSTDAINGSQLYDALNSLTSTFDQKTQQLASNSVNSIGIMDVTDPLVAIEGVRGNNTASLNGADPATTTAVAVGSSSVAAGGNAVAVGLQNVAGSNNAVAIGSFAQTGADSDYATAIGSNVQATGSEAVAMGANVEAGGDNALVIGSNNARAIGAGSVALGNNARVNANATNSIAVGTNAAVATSVQNALALGAGATVAAGSNGGVALGQGSVANRGNAVSVGGGTVGQRQIINVAAGTAATDAVNVGQLSGLTTALGGGAAVGAGGTITQPTYTVGGKDYHTVGEAIAAAAATPGDGGTDPNAVAYDDDTKSSVTLGGTAATDAVALKNVAAGAVNATSTDAINGSQLHGTAQSVADTLGGGATVGADGKIEAPTYTVGGTDVRTVGDALSNLDGRTTANTGDISDLKDKLAGSGLVDPVTGKTLAAVTYDKDAATGAANFDSLTLAGGANGTAIHNVAAGELSATSKDAVNGSQLFETNQQVGNLKDKLSEGGVFDPTTGESLAVTYTNADKTEVKLGADGTPVRVTNVADAQADNDAVNLKQLKDSGLVVTDPKDPEGGLKSLAVTYDKDPSGAANFDSLTLAGGANGTVIHNVAAGELSATSKDAVNGSQLFETNQQVGNLKDKLSEGGVFDPTTGESLAVTYTNADKTEVKLGADGTPVRVTNVADAQADNDAVNLKQLKDSGLVVTDPKDPEGGLKSLAVTYDKDPSGAANFDSLTLAGGANGTVIHNVGAGELSATSKDAVNGSQLFETNEQVGDLRGKLADSGLVDPSTGKAIAAVTYDNDAKSSVTLGGTGSTSPVALKNVADGVGDHDAVNVSQLKAVGNVVDDGKGNLTSLAVTYEGIDKDKVSLAGADGTTITNLKAGAVNATSSDAINGSQLHGTAQSVADALGGGATVGADGKIEAPTYTVGGTDVRTVGDALSNLDGRVTGNTGDIADLRGKLADSGLVDPATGKTIAAVTYDNDAKSSVTLGGTGASTPVALKNVATGVDGTDAVNVAQMNSGLSNLREDLTNGGIDLRFIKVNADQTNVAAIANGALAVAIGSGAGATGAHALALGTGARASGLDSVALGYNSVATQANTVSVGRVGNERRIVNVADGNVGFESKDAINGGQLYAAMNGLTTSVNSTTQKAIDEFSSSLDAKTQAAIDKMNTNSSQLMAASDSLVAIEGVQSPNSASLNGANPATDTAVAIGSGAVAAGGNAVANGLNAMAMSNNATAIGSFAQVGDASDYGVAMGSNAQSTGKEAVALGANVEAGADNALAIGSNGAQAVGAGSIALGSHAVVNAGAANSIAVGSNANIARNVSDALALGSGANVAAGANGGIALGAGSIANRGNALSIGSIGAERQIINVAAGTQQTDAVNVGQLAGVTNALGGNASVGADGSIVQPTYTIGDKQYHNVADALVAAAESGGGAPAEGTVAYDDATKSSVTLGGVGSTTPVALKNVANGVDDHDAVNVSQLKSAGLVGNDEDGNLTSLAVAYDSTARNSVTLGGVGAEDPVALKNVASGAVTAASTDAINGSQLFGTARSVASALGGGASVNPDGTIGAPTFSVGGKDVHTVGDALTNLDDRTTANTGDIGDLRKQLGRTGLVDPSTGESLTAVTYDVNPDGTAPRSVTLGGASATAPVALKNVADGVDDHDAVNVSQLKATGLVGEGDDGKLTSLVVAYDDANKDAVTLGGAGATAPVALKNVAAGVVNASSTDAVNGSQLYSTAKGVANALGGGATVNEDGSMSAPSIHIGSETYSNVTQAIQAAAAYGATDSMAVKYDVNPDGSTVPLSVTLGGPGSTPIILTNVADGKNQYDAVNYGQLSDLQSNLEGKIGEMDGRVGRLESGVVPGPDPVPGPGNSDVVGGTGGEDGTFIPANPGTGTGNVAIGSGSKVADGANNGTAIGSGSNVGSTGGTAIGSGSNAKGEGSTAIGQGSSASGSNSVAIGSGSVATEANTVSFGNGTESGNRRIVNIADGVNASDAATKGQLDRAMGGMQNQVNDLSRNAYSGIAAATALTMIPGVDPGKTLSFGIGGATYKGYQAVAFGGEARITQNLKMKAGVGMSSGGNSVGVGASYQW